MRVCVCGVENSVVVRSSACCLINASTKRLQHWTICASFMFFCFRCSAPCFVRPKTCLIDANISPRVADVSGNLNNWRAIRLKRTTTKWPGTLHIWGLVTASHISSNSFTTVYCVQTRSSDGRCSSTSMYQAAKSSFNPLEQELPL